MDEHSIHRLHEFLPHLARRQPDLIGLLPEDERPPDAANLGEWVLHFPQKRLMEICGEWVLESLRRLKESSPITNVMLRGCLLLSGEFDVGDAAALATGEVPPPGHPRREEVRAALLRASRVGLLIHVLRTDRYCIPFPVRLSVEGVDIFAPLEFESVRLRMVTHFAAIAEDMSDLDDQALLRHWRFANLLEGYETAVAQMEESAGLEPQEWLGLPLEGEIDAPHAVLDALRSYGLRLGKGVVLRQAESSGRLLGASILAARSLGDAAAEADLQRLMGQLHLRREDYPRAVDAYRADEELRLQLGDVLGRVVSVSAIALALREHGQPDLAVGEFRRATDLARAAQLHDAQIDTANCAARLLLDQDRSFEAIQLLDETISSVKHVATRLPAYAELLVRFGEALRREGRLSAALEWLTSANAHARTVGHRPAEAESCLELGLLYAEELDEEKSARWLRAARSLFSELTHHGGLARTLVALSRSASLAGMPEDREDMLLRALRSAHAARDMVTVSAIWRERGNIALELSRPSLALSHFVQETKALRHTRDIAGLVRAHLRIAQIYVSQDVPTNAAIELLRAQALARAWMRDDVPAEIDNLLSRVRARISEDDFDVLVTDVSEELESGYLRGG